MVFLKPLRDLCFQDIEKLKANRTCESQILDYKERLLEDSKLLKQISAFANTQGGYLVFGIREKGKGEYPEEIIGIDTIEVNTERIEQIILTGIQPRLDVRIRRIDMNPTKSIVVIEVPNSYLKPHMNAEDKKFYKRYEFEASPMTEMEVSDAYKRRQLVTEQVNEYISKLLFGARKEAHYVMGQVIVIPNAHSHIIDTSDVQEFQWIKEVVLHPEKYADCVKRLLQNINPSSNGVKCQMDDTSNSRFQRLEIHRNGCLSYATYYQEAIRDANKKMFNDLHLSLRLINVLEFASTLYQRYNYFGDVTIVCQLQPLDNSWLKPLVRNFGREENPSEINELIINREFPSSMLEEPAYIASGIMDEVYNNYGFWKCPYFENGKLIDLSKL